MYWKKYIETNIKKIFVTNILGILITIGLILLITSTRMIDIEWVAYICLGILGLEGIILLTSTYFQAYYRTEHKKYAKIGLIASIIWIITITLSIFEILDLIIPINPNDNELITVMLAYIGVMIFYLGVILLINPKKRKRNITLNITLIITALTALLFIIIMTNFDGGLGSGILIYLYLIYTLFLLAIGIIANVISARYKHKNNCKTIYLTKEKEKKKLAEIMDKKEEY